MAVFIVTILLSPLIGSISAQSDSHQISAMMADDFQNLGIGHSQDAPLQADIWWDPDSNWWETTSLDSDRNGIHDSLQNETGRVNVGLSYSRTVMKSDIDFLLSIGYNVSVQLPVVNALLIGDVDASDVWNLSKVEGVIMVERYGSVVFYGDVQTPAVKARNSTEYPIGAWDLGVSGEGINIALSLIHI